MHCIKMRPVATDVARSVVCLSVCVLVTQMCSAKRDEPIETLFGVGSDSCEPKEPCIRSSQR